MQKALAERTVSGVNDIAWPRRKPRLISSAICVFSGGVFRDVRFAKLNGGKHENRYRAGEVRLCGLYRCAKLAGYGEDRTVVGARRHGDPGRTELRDHHGWLERGEK